MPRKRTTKSERNTAGSSKNGNHDNKNHENNGSSLKSILNPIVAKTAGQEILMDAIKQNEITICDGPAGTGKSYISFGLALQYFLDKTKGVGKIKIVRPTIGSGDDDDIGYLPGDLNEKMLPFIAPLVKDSAELILKPEPYRKMNYGGGGVSPLTSLLSRIDIEVIPLRYARGRSLHNSFIILDEAQNCTRKDLKLLITRLGRNSKLVIEGDSTQCDIENSGLRDLMERLQYIDGIGMVELTVRDIIRNPLIAKILDRL